MNKNEIEVLNMFFGKTTNQKFKRLIILLITIFLFIILALNIECGYNKKDGFHAEWTKAADIKIGGE